MKKPLFPKARLVVLLSTVACVITSSLADQDYDFSTTVFRIWTSAKGSTFEARVVGTKGDDQYILEDKGGKKITVSFGQLSSKCQDEALAAVLHAKREYKEPVVATSSGGGSNKTPTFFGKANGNTSPKKTNSVTKPAARVSSAVSATEPSLVGSIWHGENPLPAAKQKNIIITFKSDSHLHWDANWDTQLNYRKVGPSKYQAQYGKMPLHLEMIDHNTMKIRQGNRQAKTFRRQK